MAARKTHTTLREEWKLRIQASNLVKRLHDHAMGETEMSQTQIKAADILLKKVAPDLARQEVTGEGGGPQKTETVIRWGNPVD
jgi:hypothetical protein